MRHKTYLINPLLVKEKGVTVHKCVQYPGEFVITFCGSYHAGFNMGYNCAEAVNFAIKPWIDVGRKAGVCKCHSDSVKIDMKCFLGNLDKEKPASPSPSKPQPLMSTRRKEKENNLKKVDNWLKCDLCKKWRKVPFSNSSFNYLDKVESMRKGTFRCNMIKKLSCKLVEENWKKKYKTVKSTLKSATSSPRKYPKRATVKV
jgi:hypothetical protein